MKLILTFTHEHHSKDVRKEVVCIEGPSVEAVRTELKALIESTTTECFRFCGQDFYVRDFRQQITYRRLAHAEMLAEQLNDRMPYSFELRGQPYIYKTFAVQPLETWFVNKASAFAEAAAPAVA